MENCWQISRLISAFTTIVVAVDTALIVLWAGGLILSVIWIVYVWTVGLSVTSLFVLGACTGFVFSPIFPLSFGFINQRLKMNPLLVGVFLCGAAFGAISFQKIAGEHLNYTIV